MNKKITMFQKNIDMNEKYFYSVFVKIQEMFEKEKHYMQVTCMWFVFLLYA